MHRTAHYTALLTRGDVVFSPPDLPHAITQIDALHRIGCVYLPEWLVHDADDLLSQPGVLPFVLAPGSSAELAGWGILQQRLDEEALAVCLNELYTIVCELGQTIPSLPYLRRSLGKLLIILGRAFSRGEASMHGRGFKDNVIEVLQAIEQHAASGEPFHVSALAEAYHMSPCHLTRLFRQCTGLSPMNYYQQRRIQHACWLLLHTDHSVTEIAHALGFADTPHFVRRFHELRGMSPREYHMRYAQETPC